MTLCYFAAPSKEALEEQITQAIHTQQYPLNPQGLYRFAAPKDTLEASWQRHKASPSITPNTAFLFTGQGSQRTNMGANLYQHHPVFKSTLDNIASIMDQYLAEPLMQILFDDTKAELLNQTIYTQPALFAFEYALARTCQHHGIHANMVIGHSVGEFVAATLAGFMSLEDGIKLICHRGKLMQALPSGGGMAAIAADFETIQSELGNLAVAGYNSPKQTVVSGKCSDIQTLCETLKEKGIKATALTVSHAFHSPLMTPMLDAFKSVAQEVNYTQPDLPLISNVTGTVITTPLSAEYWVKHVSAPVNFLASMNTLSQSSVNTLVEIGPHPILTQLAMRCIDKEQYQWLSIARKGQIQWEESLIKAYQSGFDLQE